MKHKFNIGDHVVPLVFDKEKAAWRHDHLHVVCGIYHNTCGTYYRTAMPHAMHDSTPNVRLCEHDEAYAFHEKLLTIYDKHFEIADQAVDVLNKTLNTI